MIKEKTDNKQLSSVSKLLLEFAPLLVFYFANANGMWLIKHISLFHMFNKPIFPATALFIIATALALIISYALIRRFPTMPIISFLFIVVFGGLTLWLHDDSFIKMKPTIINAFIGGILLIGLYFKKSLLVYAFDGNLPLTELGWKKLTWRCGWFFLFLAVLNEIAWRSLSTDAWTNFKVFYMPPITTAFLVYQMFSLSKHLIEQKK